MRTVRVETEPAYEVRIGPRAVGGLPAALERFARVAVLTDTQVEALHAARLGRAAEKPRLALPPGEVSKSFATLERVLDFLAAAGLDRQSALVAFGGGVIGDLGGLAAALYARGIPFVQVPTTLLAQVDSSVGGKTAVNLAAGKNLAGVFHQPSLVLADTELLATLSDDEYASGLGEVLKTVLLAGDEALAFLEQSAPAVHARDAAVLAELVERCVRLKAAVVARDPHERGERKALNLGHTFAHAIEHEAGYGRIPHGIAVATGVALALRASAEARVLASPKLIARVDALLHTLALPADLAQLAARYGARLTAAGLANAMRSDKKGVAGTPRFALLAQPGRWELDVALDEPRILSLLRTSGAG